MKLFICIVVSLWGSFAAALESWEAEVGTEIPFQISARTKANFNREFYATAGLGMSLNFLMGLHTTVSSSLGVIGEKTSEVMESALSNGFVIDLRGGWNIHRLNGLYVEAGYLFLTGGGGEVTVEQLEGAFGVEYTANPSLLSNSSLFNISSDIHALTFHAGYRWQLGANWLVNFDVGLIKPFMSSNLLDVEGVVRGSGSLVQATAVAQQLKDHVEEEISDVYLSQLFIPTGSVWLSWLF